MPTYHILDGDGQIINTVLADESFIQAAYPGKYRLAESDAPADAPTPPAAKPDYRITVLAFRNRFSSQEKTALELASLDDPQAPMPKRQQAAALRAYLKDVQAASYIDLDNDAIQEALLMLTQVGILAEGRAEEILDTDIQPQERP